MAIPVVRERVGMRLSEQAERHGYGAEPVVVGINLEGKRREATHAESRVHLGSIEAVGEVARRPSNFLHGPSQLEIALRFALSWPRGEPGSRT
jgi:hypothetical protein